MEKLQISTPSQNALVDITEQVKQAVRSRQYQDGILLIFVPHTTAGIAINEHADPSVARDIQADMERLVPWRQSYYRHAEGNSSSHTRTSFVGSSEMVIVESGSLQLGTWQGIFLCEFDGPRRRQVWLKFLED